MLDAALGNLLSPYVLSFLLGIGAGLARSDLSIPEQFAKALSIYLMFAIGLKGGVEIARYGLDGPLLLALTAGITLSFLLPLLAFAILRTACRVEKADAAAVAAHYGSVSVVTFVAAQQYLRDLGTSFEGYMVAVMAAMETPAIITGIMLARMGGSGGKRPKGLMDGQLVREIFLNGSVVLLLGAFLIGALTGPDALAELQPLFVDPFKGVLCLFLLEMGLLAARQMRGASALGPRRLAFGLVMPPIGAACGLSAGALIGLSPGGTALMGVLAASASYIAVPAAMRLAVPQAHAALYICLSLGVTFPLNLLVGIPVYTEVAAWLTGG